MSLFIKICGLRTREAVEAAVAAGADAVGFVLAESPRQVSAPEARDLARYLPPEVQSVIVMRRPRMAEWAAVLADFQPGWLQADAEAIEQMGLLDPDAPGSPVRPLPVYRDSPALAEDAIPTGGLVLFEAADSGQGVRADWQRAARLARRTRLVLAGGLTPDNVAEAIRTVRPWGVDVSSGVERSRGVKDPALIAAFVAAARAAASAAQP